MKDLTAHVIRRHRWRQLFWRLYPLLGGLGIGGLVVLLLWLLGS